MNILHLCTFQKYGGAAVAARRMIHAMRQAGMQVSMLVHKPEFEEQYVTSVADGWFNKAYNFLLFVLDRLHFWFFEKDKSVRFAFSPAKIGFPVHRRPEVQQADVLHLHWTSFGFMSVQELARLQKPIVWTLHDMWLFTGGCHYSGACRNFEQQCGHCETFLKKPSPHDLSYRVWKRKKEVFNTINQVIITPSHWLANEARKSSLLRQTPIKIIPYAIDTETFKPMDKSAARKTLELPLDKKLVLFAAAKISDERKGLKYFVEAMKEYKAHNQDNIEIVIMGGKVPDTLRQLLPYPIHATGHLSDLNKIATVYAAADVFVISSLEDNLPNTVIESLACGTPVVGFETGGIPEMIDHQRNGYVASFKSSQQLAQGIAWVLSHTYYESLSKTARQKALNTYSEAVVAAQYREVYQQMLAAKPKY